MSRNATILSALGVVVLLLGFWFLLYSPKQDEIGAVREDIKGVQDQQQQVRNQIAALEGVRAQIPEIEAQIAAAESIIPRSAALPATLRQLQGAADASGVVLELVQPARPVAATPIDDTVELPPDLAQIGLSLNLSGGYFQVVDFLRRIENPEIIARGIVWNQVDLSLDEYPTLTILLNGSMFARLEAPPDPDAEPAEEPTDDATDEPTDGETDANALPPLTEVAP